LTWKPSIPAKEENLNNTLSRMGLRKDKVSRFTARNTKNAKNELKLGGSRNQAEEHFGLWKAQFPGSVPRLL
jgi:hypothetical protein